MQEVIVAENFLKNGHQKGKYLVKLIHERLLTPDALVRPSIFNIASGKTYFDN